MAMKPPPPPPASRRLEWFVEWLKDEDEVEPWMAIHVLELASAARAEATPRSPETEASLDYVQARSGQLACLALELGSIPSARDLA